jgi:hypothetical protein
MKRVALLWRGDPNAPTPTPANNRLHRVFEALAARNVAAEPVVYADDVVEQVRARLSTFDGVLVWVDPITEGRDRSALDPMLREVAQNGVWVSAHPSVVLKMGTKEVLVRTRELGWNADTHLYRTIAEFNRLFPVRLGSSGPRVLKQNRGNGGLGVWKVEWVANDSEKGMATPSAGTMVKVLHARRDSLEEEMRLGEFMRRCESYFSGSGCLIDQAYQPRLSEGMIRCYLVQNSVVGFGHQLIRALLPAPAGSDPATLPQPGPRIMHDSSAPAFQRLRTTMEQQWVPALQRVLDIDSDDLPVIWDADFLYGPKTSSGEDSYVLCEINVSAVFPFPDSALAPMADATVACLRRGDANP